MRRGVDAVSSRLGHLGFYSPRFLGKVIGDIVYLAVSPVDVFEDLLQNAHQRLHLCALFLNVAEEFCVVGLNSLQFRIELRLLLR